MNNMESTSNLNSMLHMRSSGVSTQQGGASGSGGGSGPHRLDLPPGFRFHPTDEELVLHYLKNKVSSRPLPVPIITEIDLYKFDPWDLPGKAICGESEWYFFTPRDRKYPNGARPNRAAGSGYWKATGTDKPISTVVCAGHQQVGSFQHQQHMKLGVKKALVFYKGRPPKGVKTNWIMHEYRLVPDPSTSKAPSFSTRRSLRLDDWVLCRIYRKNSQATRVHTGSDSNSCVEEVLGNLPDEDMHQDEVNISTQIYNHTRALPRYGSLGRLVMGSMAGDPFLESLVTDQVSTSSVNPLGVPNLPLHAHHIHDPQSSWTSNLGQLDSNNIPTTIQNSNTFFARVESDDCQKRNAIASNNLNVVDNMGLNIGLASIFPSMHHHHQQHHLHQQQQPHQQQQQRMQQQAPCEDTSTSGGEVGDNTSIRWPFGDSRPKFPFA